MPTAGAAPEAALDRLQGRLRELDQVVVAFSGGADSAFLAWVAHDTLGAERALAVTAVSPRWRRPSTTTAGPSPPVVAAVATGEHGGDGQRRRHRANDGDRCFYRKDALMGALTSPWWRPGRHRRAGREPRRPG